VINEWIWFFWVFCWGICQTCAKEHKTSIRFPRARHMALLTSEADLITDNL